MIELEPSALKYTVGELRIADCGLRIGGMGNCGLEGEAPSDGGRAFGLFYCVALPPQR
jgi:hypothetical protein